MRKLIFLAGLLLIPTLLQAQNSAEYWRDRQYADRIRAEERRHQLEIERIRAQTAIEVAKQNRRHYHNYRPQIVGPRLNNVAPRVPKISVIRYQGVRHPGLTAHSRDVEYRESAVNFVGTGYSYSSTRKKRVTRIGTGR